MEFQQTIIYPTNYDHLVTIMSTPQFLVSRFADHGATCHVDTLEPENEQIWRYETRASIPNSEFPDSVRGFLPLEIHLRLRESLSVDDDGTAHIDSVFSFEKLPIEAHASSILRSAGSQTQRDVHGEVKVKIPFFGKKVEAEIIKNLHRIFDAEIHAVEKALDAQ